MAAQAGQNFGIGEAAGIINGNVQMLVADAAGAVMQSLLAGDAVANAVDLAQGLNIEMKHLTGSLAFVADHRGLGLQAVQPVQAETTQHKPDTGARHTQSAGNGWACLALPTHVLDCRNPIGGQTLSDVVGRRAAVGQLPVAATIAAQPAIGGPFRHPAAVAARFTVQPASIRSTKSTRPDGVRRAFLWMFIRGLRQGLELRNPNLPPKSRVNNLHSFDT